VAADLHASLGKVEGQMAPFSLLDSDNGANCLDAGLEISELIAREGTVFITADYVFQLAGR
jgi:hypothetical protein